jgi:cell division protein ZapA
MSKENPQAVSINILGKEYLVACPENERKELQTSADYLDRKMREIRDSGKVIGTDRIAVMAALNIAHELLHENGSEIGLSQDIEGRIKGIQEKIEDALFKSRQLELEA